MDPYPGYDFEKDTSHLMMLEAHSRGHRIFYGGATGIFLSLEGPHSHCQEVRVLRGSPYFEFQGPGDIPLGLFDLVFMRRDPPYDMSYLYTAQILLLSRRRVVNDPLILATRNEKLIIFEWPQYIPRTLVTSDVAAIERFTKDNGHDLMIKDLGKFAAKGTWRIQWGTDIFYSKIREMTQEGKMPVMVQPFLNKVSEGEKRVLFLEGDVLSVINRIPPKGGFVTSPHGGAVLHRDSLTPREQEICQQVGSFLKEKGVFIAGLDLIGEMLIEVNITSPGLVWEHNEMEKASFEKEIVNRMERRCMAS
ncbi:MAG: hypothetical protein A3B79_02785 [Deltaproteobacteria bacterium RIFCSPHIGHO2_02_FULL_50_15]|nr:MAG: hypothetical protein A3B79_02785 [Deltaproteobacteria bacterium RIFCSPHIGHO2_02_FULL_50_15]